MEPGFVPSEIDTSRPHTARMYDYYLGGKDNYAVDQEAAEEVLRAAPEVREIARHNRAFLQRVVRFLVRDRGIRQIIDVGTGIPTAGNVHEVAHQIDPGVRVVYVDNDPIVHVHANALLTGAETTGIVLADLREPGAILANPTIGRLIDFSQPVAVLLIAILHFLTDDEDPAGVIATFRSFMPNGSYLAISHVTGDFRPQAAADAAAVYDRATSAATLRRHAAISAFFDGFELEEPGLVQVPRWRPDHRPPRNLDKIWIHGGVGRKTSTQA